VRAETRSTAPELVPWLNSFLFSVFIRFTLVQLGAVEPEVGVGAAGGRVAGFGFRVSGLGFRVKGLGRGGSSRW